MRVLVLGATGFIGGQIARALIERGYRVRALRRPSSSMLALDGLQVELATGDLRDRVSLLAAMRDVEAVFHAAGYYPPNSLAPRRSLRMAVGGMRAVLECAREAGVRRVVYTSSLSTIGPASNGRALADERDAYLPGSVAEPYFEVKWAMEAEVYRAVAAGQEVVALCPTVVFGPGDVKPTTGLTLLALRRGLMPAYIEGVINIVDVRDVAQAHVTALERGRSGERYILGGHNTSLGETLRLAARIAGVAPPRVRVPAGLALLAGKLGEVASLAIPRRPFLPLCEAIEMIRHGQHYDCGKAQRDLSLATRPLEETLGDSLEWFRQHGYLKGEM
ncbi:MAG TPA: NAD-dependent epimerase/dehydratase family protein [Roseiflexaceae bacterium]